MEAHEELDELFLSLKTLYEDEDQDVDEALLEEHVKQLLQIFKEEEIFFENRVNKIWEVTGYDFKDPYLLERAFTHHSYAEDYSESYERLEFIGDSVLNMLVAKDHYFTYPDLDPGKLTRLRNANADNEKLARAALNFGFHKLLRHKLPLLAGQIEEFSETMKEYPVHSFGLLYAPKVLADVVEALIGAIFIDTNSSMDTTWKIIKTLLQPMIIPKNLHLHPVTLLNELCQKNNFKVKARDLWRDRGEVEFFLDGEFIGSAKYVPKRSIAYNRAAKSAYNSILRKLQLEVSKLEDVLTETTQN